jgi:hypothetical protein
MSDIKTHRIVEGLENGEELAGIVGATIADVHRYLKSLKPEDSKELVDFWLSAYLSNASRDSLGAEKADLDSLKLRVENAKHFASMFGDRANSKTKPSEKGKKVINLGFIQTAKAKANK